METENGIILELMGRVIKLERQNEDLNKKIEYFKRLEGKVEELNKMEVMYAPEPKGSRKYKKFTEYLKDRLNRCEVTIDFSTIEELTGEKLPRTARRDRSFWANTMTHGIPKAWFSAGFGMGDVDLKEEKITFYRYDSPKLKKGARKILLKQGYSKMIKEEIENGNEEVCS